ncbi:MAG: hypothetical protein QOH96_1669 [Blastocatellia bacterium]|nr:hypothetical protein [Blastocatellia bacterium]
MLCVPGTYVVTFDGAIGRGLFVGVCAFTIFIAVRYFRSLTSVTFLYRLALVLLRVISCLLVGALIAGVTVTSNVRVRDGISLETDPGLANSDSKLKAAFETVKNDLARAGVTVASSNGIDGPSPSDQPATINSAILFTEAGFDGSTGRRMVRNLSEKYGGVRVDVVVPDIEPGPKVALLKADIEGTPVRGVPFRVRCIVHGSDLANRETIVSVTDDSGIQTSAKVNWTTNNQQQVLLLELTPKVSGFLDYQVHVEGTGNEPVALLNRKLTVNVEERRYRILFFEGQPTWEAKFIRRALDQAKLFDVDYFTQVSREASLAQTPENDSEEKEVVSKAGPEPIARLHTLLASAERLNNYDAVLVGATSNDFLSAAEVSRLRAWVENRGGGLVVLGTNNFAGSIVSSEGKLNQLLPANVQSRSYAGIEAETAQSEPVQATRPTATFGLRPVENSEQTGLQSFFDSSRDSKTDLDRLSGNGLILGPLRPGATTLAMLGAGSGNSAEQRPAIVSMQLGRGCVLLFGPSDSWRLKAEEKNPDEQHAGQFETLWQGTVLHALSGLARPAEFDLENITPAEGEDIQLSLIVRNASFVPLKIDSISAQLQKLDTGDTKSDSTPISFGPELTGEAVWRANVPFLTAGLYSLNLDYTAGGREGTVQKLIAVSAPLEFAAGTAIETLESSASELGGRLVRPSNAKLLVQEAISRTAAMHNSVFRWRLISWWPLALIIPLLLSAEWLLQRLTIKPT